MFSGHLPACLSRSNLRKLSAASVTRGPGRQLGGASWFLTAGLASVAGRYRPDNEDSCYANIREGVFLVADGIGGRPGGELASQVLVDSIPPALMPHLQSKMTTPESLRSQISQSIAAAQRAMQMAADADSSLCEMGSTLVMGVVAGKSLFLTHLGDSRAYLVRGGRIRQLTTDHTLVQVMIDAGELMPSRASRHRLRHVVLEFVGAQRKCANIDVQEVALRAGDRLLFATDGLTDVLNDSLLAEAIQRDTAPQVTAELLVQQALEMDSKDNVSAMVVHVEASTSR
jgi:protein phosphatase